MNKWYYVVTNINCGWDNVGGIYLAESEEKVRAVLDEECGEDTEDYLIIHGPKRLEEI